MIMYGRPSKPTQLLLSVTSQCVPLTNTKRFQYQSQTVDADNISIYILQINMYISLLDTYILN
jgi:hypothetical protein